MRHVLISMAALIVGLTGLSQAYTETSTIIWLCVIVTALIAVILNYVRFIKQTKNHE